MATNRLGLFGLLPVAAFCWYLGTPHAHPLLTHDSPGYVTFTEGRPAGYPALIWLVHAITGSFQAIPTLQALLICACALALGLAARPLMGMPVALLMQGVILIQPGPLREADQLLADAPSTALTMLFAAAILRCAAPKAMTGFTRAALIAAVALTVRPDNAALFAGLLVLAGSNWRRYALTAACFVAAQGVTAAAQFFVHGSVPPNPRLAAEFFQKAALLTQRPAGVLNADDAFIEHAAAPLRAYIAQAPARFQSYLQLRIGTVLRYQIIEPGLAQRHQAAHAQDILPILREYTMETIKADPLLVPRAAASGYTGLVMNHTFHDAVWVREYAAYVTAHPPPWAAMPPPPAGDAAAWQTLVAETGTKPGDVAYLSQAQTAYLAPPPARGAFAIIGLKGVQVSACAAAWLFLLRFVSGALRGGAVFRAGVALSLTLQIHLLAAGFLEFPLPRYVFTVWPLMVTILALAVATPNRQSYSRQERVFFFEKKKQKTFIHLASSAETAGCQVTKVFCFFFSKKKAFLATPATSPQPARHHPAGSSETHRPRARAGYSAQ